MPIPRIEDLPVQHPRHGSGSKWWAEWCFLRVCFAHFRVRLAIMLVILLTGAFLFWKLEPEMEQHTLVHAMYLTFALTFGETPDFFPESWILQGLFFLVPILGLTVIIEGIVDFALMLRDRRRYERSWCDMLASSFENHIVLVGFGRLGYRTFLTLRRLGEAVVVIERDPKNRFLETLRRDGSPLFIGDARHEALLDDANITKAKSIILATNDDMANLEAALDARKVNPDIRVVLRMFDQNMADKVRDGFNIHLAMSPSAISAPTFASCAVAAGTINSFIVGDQLVAMQRWLVREPGPLCGKTIADVIREHGVGVVEHRRGSEPRSLIPDADTRLEAGDGLMLQGPLEKLQKLRKLGGIDGAPRRRSAAAQVG